MPIDFGAAVLNFRVAECKQANITLAKEKIVYAPNVFSPNFDGRNDYFQLFPGCGVASIRNLKIVDRWGAIVYSRNTIDHRLPQEFWDGFINGEPAAPGVYVWQVEIELVDGSRQRFFGDVSLVR